MKTGKFIALAAFASLAFGAVSASASEEYPAAMKQDLKLDYTPSCELCHAHAAMPVGDADQPFAKSLAERGLQGDGDVKSLASALAKDKGVDSDGDGAEDLDELSWGGNPNVSDAPKEKAPPQVQYGCGSTPKDQGTASLGFVAVALGLAFSNRRRNRSKSSRSRLPRKQSATAIGPPALPNARPRWRARENADGDRAPKNEIL